VNVTSVLYQIAGLFATVSVTMTLFHFRIFLTTNRPGGHTPDTEFVIILDFTCVVFLQEFQHCGNAGETSVRITVGCFTVERLVECRYKFHFLFLCCLFRCLSIISAIDGGIKSKARTFLELAPNCFLLCGEQPAIINLDGPPLQTGFSVFPPLV